MKRAYKIPQMKQWFTELRVVWIKVENSRHDDGVKILKLKFAQGVA